jgi:ABC-2 type transport system permease protein
VVRHTRAEESAGRLELVGSAVVGRYAALTAALLVAGGADLVLALLVALGLIACGLPVAGSIAMGLGFASSGWIFAAIAAAWAQLVENPRAANGIAAATVGAAYLLRAAGDAGRGSLSWLSWASPIGWVQRVRPFADERWWVLALAAAVAVGLAVVAHALCARRDLGAGLLPPRTGPAAASRSLGSALGLAWRLQRGTLVGWTASFVVVGGVLGGVAFSVDDLVSSSPRLQALFAALGGQTGIVDAFFAAVFSILGFVAAAYAIQATLQLRSEEEDTRAELVLAASVSRLAWATSHLVFAAIGPAIALAAAATAAGVVHGGRNDVAHLLTAALVQLPAIWVLLGVALALLGLAPRLARASWGVLVACVLLGQLGRLLRLPSWAMDLSPFTHLPQPGGAVRIVPLVLLAVVAAALTVAGLVGLERRDLA